MKINKFWKKNKDLIFWHKKPKKIFNGKWFEDGKVNVSYNCLEENLKKNLGKKNAIIFYDKNLIEKKYTYEELYLIVNNFCTYLTKIIKKNNSRIIIHGSASIESAVSMLSCSRLGIFHSVIFDELNYESINLRLKIFKPDIIISRADDNEIKIKFKEHLKKTIVFRDLETKLNVKDNINIKFLTKNKTEFKKLAPLKSFKSNKNFFCLFTSGSTGEPKGIIHTMGPYLLYSKFTCKKYFGLNKNSVILTASDAGWINGHTYALYGPLSLGCTTILLESPLLILDRFFFKKIIIENKISILYLPVTLIRLLKGIIKNKIKSKFLKTLGSMGEPLAPSVGLWYSKIFNLKNKSIINTYFQTETGGIITAPTFKNNINEHPHGSVGKINNLVGMFIDKKKNEILLKYSWPGCLKSVINGKKFYKKYWNSKNYFRMFDVGKLDKNSLYVNGRSDDVLNVRGHRIGSEEIESIILKINTISEASAVGVPDLIEGSKIIIFLKLLKKDLNVQKKIEDILVKYFGSYAIPKKIIIMSNLPKTRSGKILRRILRNICLNPLDPNIGDSSTILNYQAITEAINKVKYEGLK